MAKAFNSPAAFKNSLASRLQARAKELGVPTETVQFKFVMERLLARLFHAPDAPWLLKGGFAMDLRYRPRARTTTDIDLSASLTPGQLWDRLQAAAGKDLGDYLTFRIGKPKKGPDGPGGWSFPCEAVLAGKTYRHFNIDVGLGDAVFGEPELLTGNVLESAGLGSVVARAIPRPQQFAEKAHAYTFPWGSRFNSRSKDLVDMVLIIELDPPEPERVRAALQLTFSTRNTHPLPKSLDPPPKQWEKDFPGLAREAALSTENYLEAFARLSKFWNDNSLGGE